MLQAEDQISEIIVQNWSEKLHFKLALMELIEDQRIKNWIYYLLI